MKYLYDSGEINNYRKGMGISNLPGSSLSSITLPLPPLAEQKKIVERLDELMAICDSLEGAEYPGSVGYQGVVVAGCVRGDVGGIKTEVGTRCLVSLISLISCRKSCNCITNIINTSIL
jgi:Type I restriction modification DNA specificity domain